MDRFASHEDTFSMVAAREQSKELNRLLDGISGREAEVIRLRAFSDLSFADVAVIVGASVSTVKSRFRYGIDKMRRALQAKGGTR
jgi:RNA polymerase sigma-70 factor (ECF subfamily)